jgi:Putative phage holin Dp-1
MTLSNKVYDILKQIAQVVLPAVGTLYFALAAIWTFPDGKQVVGSITAFDAFLGVILSVLASSYKPAADGKLLVDDNSIKKLQMDLEAHEIIARKALVLNVVHTDDAPAAPVQPS